MNVSVSEAVARLKAWPDYSVAQAIDGLCETLDRVQLLSLYARLFPRAYKRSQASAEAEGAGYSPREREFMALIDEHYFPLELDWLEEANERVSYILIRLCGFDMEDDWETVLEQGWPVALLAALVWDEYRENWEHLAADAGTALPQPLEGRLDWKKFARMCRRAGFKALPAAIELVGHNTNTVFLDGSPDCYHEPAYDWSLAALRDLRRAWRRARKYLTAFDEVVRRLENDPSQAVQVVCLWNQCIEEYSHEES